MIARQVVKSEKHFSEVISGSYTWHTAQLEEHTMAMLYTQMTRSMSKTIVRRTVNTMESENLWLPTLAGAGSQTELSIFGSGA